MKNIKDTLHVAGTVLTGMLEGSIEFMRFVIISLVMMTGMTIRAQIATHVVSSDEAESVAKQLLRKEVVRVDVDNVSSLHRKAQSKTNAPAYYIYNSSDGNGFVIVSGEKETEQVLAYSTEGSFDVSKVEFGADAFLNTYDDCIADIRSGEITVNAAKQRRAKVTPKLLKTFNWNQSGAFFNRKYAPLLYSQECLSGCGPTAMAIVMRYWEHPAQGRGSHSYTSSTNKLSLSRDLSQESFDWSLMTNYPSVGSKQSDAVSRLMLDCGIAMSVDYGTYVTNGFLNCMAHAFKDHFDYVNPKLVMRQMESIGDWDEIILNEIENNRPCIVAAQGKNDRHIFVVDGVNAEGLFHYNLGWGGSNNGYYRDGAIAGSQISYATDELIYGIHPVEEYQPTSQLSFSGFQVMDNYNNEELKEIELDVPFMLKHLNVWNLGPTPFVGRLVHVELRDKEGETKCVVSNEMDFFDLQSNYYYGWILIGCTIRSSDTTVEPGDRLWLCAQDDDGEYLPVLVIDEENSSVALDDYIPALSPIQSVSETNTSVFPAYDLQGRKVSQWYKGIVIQNGKKMLRLR